MDIEFDPDKSARNERERGLPFQFAAALEWEKAVVATDERHDYGEVREITAGDLKLFRPIAEVDPGMVEAMNRMKSRIGRPKIDRPKKLFGLRLDQNVIDGIKATGRGYNARVESVLREALSAGKLDARDLLDPK